MDVPESNSNSQEYEHLQISLILTLQPYPIDHIHLYNEIDNISLTIEIISVISLRKAWWQMGIRRWFLHRPVNDALTVRR